MIVVILQYMDFASLSCFLYMGCIGLTKEKLCIKV